MPLHLLSKKSWNVYNPAAIARVRADEAEAAAREEAHEQQLEEYEAAKRLALLRGEEPPPPPPQLENEPTSHGASLSRKDGSASEKRERDRDPAYLERRKRRKLAGEDDTDRDIRVARQQEEERKARRDDRDRRRPGTSRAEAEDVPIVDHAGHIQLFAPPSTREIRMKKEKEAQVANRKDDKDGEDAGGLRFKDAAGFKNRLDAKPWYAAGSEASMYTGTEEVEQQRGDAAAESSKGRDAFGNEDAGRFKRDAARLSAADPMAAMAKAQTKIKEVENARDASRRERERELNELKESQWREEQRQARKRERYTAERRRNDEDSLDGFSLDADYSHQGRQSSSHHHKKHRSHRDRSREQDRSIDRTDRSQRHHRHRSRDEHRDYNHRRDNRMHRGNT